MTLALPVLRRDCALQLRRAGRTAKSEAKENDIMRFTANSCATEGIEETFDRYDGILGRDLSVQEAEMRVKDMIGCIRDVLIKGKKPTEALSLLDELDDAYVNLDTEKLKTLAKTGWNDVQVAFELGRKYCKLEELYYRHRRCDPDEERSE